MAQAADDQLGVENTVSIVGLVQNSQGSEGTSLHHDPKHIINHVSYFEIKSKEEKLQDESKKNGINIMCISDTHNRHDEIDISKWKDANIDILIHCGDITMYGKYENIVNYNNWIKYLKSEKLIKESVVIAGNHDITLHKEYFINGVKYKNEQLKSGFEQWPAMDFKNIKNVVKKHKQYLKTNHDQSDAKEKNNKEDEKKNIENDDDETKKKKLRKKEKKNKILSDYCDLCLEGIKQDSHYLQDSSIELFGIKIYGSPWQPHYNNWAFNQERGEISKKRWDIIGKDCNIVLTHGPPFLHGDETNAIFTHNKEIKLEDRHVGCKQLLKRINEIEPKYHIFGHLHEGYGVTFDKENKNTMFMNASTVTFEYEVLDEQDNMYNPPFLFKLFV